MEKLELTQKIIGKGEVKGYVFSKEKQSHKAYLFKVNTGTSIYYEVFKRKAKTNSIRDCFPTSKAFGTWAWTFTSYDKAIVKFNRLNSVKND